MWKYILTVSLVLIAAGLFVLYKTHQGLVSANGEVAALQVQYENAIAKSKEIYTDEIISAYARMRSEWLIKCKSEAEEQEAKFREEDVTYTTEIERLEAEIKSMGGLRNELNLKKQCMLDSLVNDEIFQKALSDLQEKGNVQVADMDASDPDVFSNIATNVNLLKSKREEISGEITKDESTIQSLQSRIDALNEASAKEDALARERQARISPESLSCNVIMANRGWDYVIVDAGVSDGVVIGSRLSVMRGSKKICEVSVTLVEDNRSSCDIVMNTLLAGEAVEPGDRVVSVRPVQKN